MSKCVKNTNRSARSFSKSVKVLAFAIMGRKAKDKAMANTAKNNTFLVVELFFIVFFPFHIIALLPVSTGMFLSPA